MAVLGFSLFETAIGCCGIVWGERGILGVQLPEARNSATRARLLERFPDAREIEPPLAVRRARAAISGLLRGEATDLSTVVLDMQCVPAFHQRVYAAVRKIKPGHTLSYGEIAAELGVPGAARAVGQAMRRNPFAIVVPCHRVLAARGKLGGFTANGGASTKLRMLAIEGVEIGASGPPHAEARAPKAGN
jgi:methylated-DNA-[protein]-cysteine S-methyltransferase